VVQGYARTKDADLRQAAQLFETIGRLAEANDLFHQLAKDEKRPVAVLELAAFLGRQGRTAEALELCEHAPAACRTADVANACIVVMYASKDRSRIASASSTGSRGWRARRRERSI
jgi:predicted Zn-dependent protease